MVVAGMGRSGIEGTGGRGGFFLNSSLDRFIELRKTRTKGCELFEETRLHWKLNGRGDRLWKKFGQRANKRDMVTDNPVHQ
jgi:hypothetical protein